MVGRPRRSIAAVMFACLSSIAGGPAIEPEQQSPTVRGLAVRAFVELVVEHLEVVRHHRAHLGTNLRHEAKPMAELSVAQPRVEPPRRTPRPGDGSVHPPSPSGCPLQGAVARTARSRSCFSTRLVELASSSSADTNSSQESPCGFVTPPPPLIALRIVTLQTIHQRPSSWCASVIRPARRWSLRGRPRRLARSRRRPMRSSSAAASTAVMRLSGRWQARTPTATSIRAGEASTARDVRSFVALSQSSVDRRPNEACAPRNTRLAPTAGT